MGEAAAGASAVARTLFLYGVFLAGCGYYGAASRGMNPKAMHSLYMGAGGGTAVAICGLLSSRSSKYVCIQTTVSWHKNEHTTCSVNGWSCLNLLRALFAKRIAVLSTSTSPAYRSTSSVLSLGR